MKGIILLNGEPYNGKIEAGGAVVFCCDGAYEWARGKVKIDKNIGDFDSLFYTPDPPPEEVYPAEKNFTDGEIALHKMLCANVDSIQIYGGGGRREDHFLGNLHLLYRAWQAGVYAELITNYSLIFAASGKIELGAYKGRTFSVLPFGGPLHIMDYGGVKYNYPQTIVYGECRGVSNVVQSDSAFVTVGGLALIFVNRGEL